MISANLIRQSFPLCSDPEGWASALAPALERFEITSDARLCSFLAQTGHESGQFNHLVEGLSYSAARLTRVWPRRFPTEAAAMPYARNEIALANNVYANRLGNGDAASGDGYRYRGRGIIQITGRSNYAAVGAALKLDLIGKPDLLVEKANAALSAAWFWHSRGLNALADDETDDDDLEDFGEITRRINGGKVGLQERLALFNKIKAIL
jgi:putative chitinase